MDWKVWPPGLLFECRGGVVGTRRIGTRVQVKVPYNKDFIVAAHHMKGRWRGRSKVWSFPDNCLGDLQQALREVYGYTHPL